ncbi:MAG TPA: hypothetical protein VNK91_02345 [Burkholderiaceae bacterium]|nr:hypothetical protein [Burkholderiaceae bacterium]
MSDRVCSVAPVVPPALKSAAVDLDGCDVLEITVGLFEHEQAGHRMESWPPVVQRKVEELAAEWLARNPTRRIRLVSVAATKSMCVLLLHHAAK